MLSLLAKGYVRYGVDVGSYLCVLIGRTRCPATLDPGLPAYAARIADVMPLNHPLSSLKLLLRGHTVLPYYLFFASANRRERVINQLHGSQRASADNVLGIKTNRLAPPALPRLCSKCVQSSTAKGQSVSYLVEHQLPTTWVCAEHRVVLTDGCELCREQAHLPRNLLRMPGRCADHRHEQSHACTALDPAEIDDAQWFAAQGKRMLERYGDAPEDPQGALRKIVGEKFRRSGRGDNLALAHAIERRFSSAMLARLGLSFTCETDRKVGWHKRLRCADHDMLKEPCQWLAVLGAIGSDVDDFLDQVRATSVSANLSVKAEWENDLLVALIARNGAFAAVHKTFGISFGDLWKAMIERKWTVSRPADVGISEGIYRKLVNAWDAGMDQMAMERTFGVSQYFLQKMTLWEPGLYQRWQLARMELRLEAHRETLRATISAHPDIKRSEFPKAVRAAFDYVFLKDRQWLDQVLPRRGPKQWPKSRSQRVRTDFHRKDAELSERILAWAPTQLGGDGRPVHLTTTKILRSVGIVDFYFRYRDRFPKATEQLKRFVEPRDVFILRRLRWAATWCAQAGAPLKGETIRVKAALRRRYVDQHWKEVVEAYDAVRGLQFVGLGRPELRGPLEPSAVQRQPELSGERAAI